MGINVIRPISEGISKTADNLYDLSNDGIEARGDFGASATISTSGAGTRMVWYPKKSALRAGTVSGAEWDNANIGDYSAAFGKDNLAKDTADSILGGEGNSTGGGSGWNTIAGGYQNIVNDGYGSIFIGGGESNTVTEKLSVICGGVGNLVDGSYSTIGGGYYNTASIGYSVVGGGYQNVASGYRATIGGGRANTASNDGALVTGGLFNTASGVASSVLGGDSNSASGISSIVLGGASNTAGGDYSVVNGKNANLTATADRTVYFGYSNSDNIPVSGANLFIIHGDSGFEKKVGIQTLTPTATLDINGTFVVASTATFNGDVAGITSDTSSIATAGAFATPYQPDTSNAAFVTVSIRCQISLAAGTAYIEVKSDSSATPTTVIATAGIESGLLNEDNTFICSFFVKKGNYFQIDKTESNGTVTIKQWRVDAVTIG